MERKRQIGCSLLGMMAVPLICSSAVAVDLTGSVRLHDPSRIHKEGGRYYTFSTGNFFAPIASKYSDNFTHWQNGPAVFSGIPAWAEAEVPNHAGFMWAPDVFYFNGEYRLYYSLSSFGSQNSVIGLATNTTLDFNDPDYEWVDQEMVIESENGYPYNTIDAGIFYDETTSRMWMTFGSYWNGIYISELDPTTGKRIDPSPSPLNIARNPVNPPNAIEASFLTAHDGHYYLFVNWDSCCQGSNSTYKIRVGRSSSPTGPFRDRNELAMTSGGGELLLATEGDFIGPGHFSDYSENGIDYFSYHYYDGDDFGRSKLAIDEFAWTFDGWPVLVSDLPAGDYNRNGIVEAGDYTLWRDTLGSTTDLRANGTDEGASNGVVDMADYDVWRLHYGEAYNAASGLAAAALNASVPEPTSASMLSFAAAALVFLRRRSFHVRQAALPNGRKLDEKERW